MAGIPVEDRPLAAALRNVAAANEMVRRSGAGAEVVARELAANAELERRIRRLMLQAAR